MAAVVPVVSKPSNEQSVLHDSQVPKMIGLHGRCIKLHHIELDLNIYNRYKYIYIKIQRQIHLNLPVWFDS